MVCKPGRWRGLTLGVISEALSLSNQRLTLQLAGRMRAAGIQNQAADYCGAANAKVGSGGLTELRYGTVRALISVLTTGE